MNLHLRRFLLGIGGFITFIVCFILAYFCSEFIKENPQIFNPIGWIGIVLILSIVVVLFLYYIGAVLEPYLKKERD